MSTAPIQRIHLQLFPAHISMVLGDRIRENIARLRDQRGWSRPDLGKRCTPPTSGQQIERLEKDQRNLTVKWIERLAQAFRVDPAELIAPDQEQFIMTEQVAEEVARSLARVVLRGDEPAPAIVQDLALIVRELSETFSKHQQARHDVQVARPVIDLLVNRRAPPSP